jgi:hypothetical protein
MSLPTVLLPLFVQIALTFVLWFWMAYHRVTVLRSGQVKPGDVALREPNWPPRALQIANAAHNQLEIPLLFYVLTILAIITHKADFAFVVLSWIFVLSRLAHAYIHVTSNEIALRGPSFGLGLFVLAIMWVIFSVRILAGSP